VATAISVEHLSKEYRLGVLGGGMLVEDLNRWWAKVRGRPDPLLTVGEEHRAGRFGQHFWALADVSFELEEGEVLGIIGRNGAGKSTLLKIMSQVTAPTSGQIKLRGRVASLLEVGTGFHLALTGRENIFLNGAILGMSKAEIRRKFDEIVAFSECEAFIDTPVRRYSSGMYLRLAFAVAAHLESEILIVDEVLAVGDAGRTVLFVSHNLHAVRKLCSRGLVLQEGKLCMTGGAGEAVDYYHTLVNDDRARQESERSGVDVVPEGKVRFVAWELVLEDDGLPENFEPGVYWIGSNGGRGCLFRRDSTVSKLERRAQMKYQSAPTIGSRLNCSRWWASVPRHLPPQGRGEINECVTCHVREAPGPARAC